MGAPADDDFEDFYALLELEKGPEATPNEIKKQHRQLARKWHPDKNRDDPKVRRRVLPGSVVAAQCLRC